jgi:hypothetical protein
MTHIAIQEPLDGKTVVWLEKVSDDQYLGRADWVLVKMSGGKDQMVKFHSN